MELEDISSLWWPNTPWLCPVAPYLGYVLIKRDSSDTISSTIDTDDAEYFGRVNNESTYVIGFDHRFKDERNLPSKTYQERYWIKTNRVVDPPSSESSTTGCWNSFNPPYNTGRDNDGISNQIGGTSSTWYKCYSACGHDVEYWDDSLEPDAWIPAPDGSAGLYHWIYHI
jgi:hypothetical protein